MKKYWYIIPAVLLIFAFYILIDNKNKPIDCDTFTPFYLKASELQYASKIADKENVIVVIPELNQIIGRTEILNCPNFDYEDYISFTQNTSNLDYIKQVGSKK